jgi:hypothetical protein
LQLLILLLLLLRGCQQPGECLLQLLLLGGGAVVCVVAIWVQIRNEEEKKEQKIGKTKKHQLKWKSFKISLIKNLIKNKYFKKEILFAIYVDFGRNTKKITFVSI